MRRCTEYHTWDFESISSLIQGTLCRHFFGMTSIKVFKVCYLTANVFFALCKYSTGKGLVTNVNKEKKNGSMKYFFQRVPHLYMDI